MMRYILPSFGFAKLLAFVFHPELDLLFLALATRDIHSTSLFSLSDLYGVPCVFIRKR